MHVKTILDIHATIRRARLDLAELIAASDHEDPDYPIHPSANEIRAVLADLDELRQALGDELPGIGAQTSFSADLVAPRAETREASLEDVVDDLGETLKQSGRAWWDGLTPQERAEWVTWWSETRGISPAALAQGSPTEASDPDLCDELLAGVGMTRADLMRLLDTARQHWAGRELSPSEKGLRAVCDSWDALRLGAIVMSNRFQEVAERAPGGPYGLLDLVRAFPSAAPASHGSAQPAPADR